MYVCMYVCMYVSDAHWEADRSRMSRHTSSHLTQLLDLRSPCHNLCAARYRHGSATRSTHQNRTSPCTGDVADLHRTGHELPAFMLAAPVAVSSSCTNKCGCLLENLAANCGHSALVRPYLEVFNCLQKKLLVWRALHNLFLIKAALLFAATAPGVALLVDSSTPGLKCPLPGFGLACLARCTKGSTLCTGHSCHRTLHVQVHNLVLFWYLHSIQHMFL